MSQFIFSTEADRLFQLKAQAAELAEQIKAVEDDLKAYVRAEPVEFEGNIARVVVTPVSQSRVDWKAVAAKLSPSRQLITAYTKAVSYKRVSRPTVIKREAA